MDGRPLKIIHCFRSPVGGIFRHVRDLVQAQAAAGHAVGILCDSITGGRFEERLIEDLAPKAVLGIHRLTMRRSIAPSDLFDIRRTYAMLKGMRPDILHGHGAKGGAYARIVGTALRGSGQTVARLYTPHGGSLHYDPRSARGRLFFTIERRLEPVTDHLLFVSEYEETAYREKVGRPNVPSRVVYNGLAAADFEAATAAPDAADFLYLGMLRPLKGPDLLIEALGQIQRRTGRPATAAIVGAGEQKPQLLRLCGTLVPGTVRFHDPMPARHAFTLGRVLVLPSRADSLPYVLLEALAAGLPVTAVDVGGVREIIPSSIQPLVRPADPVALAEAMEMRLHMPPGNPPALTRHVRQRFVATKMAEETMAAYRRALGERAYVVGRMGVPDRRVSQVPMPAGALRRASDLARQKES